MFIICNKNLCIKFEKNFLASYYLQLNVILFYLMLMLLLMSNRRGYQGIKNRNILKSCKDAIVIKIKIIYEIMKMF